MLSLNKIKFINSLKVKKYRHLQKLFLVEGEKIIQDLLIFSPQKINRLFATKSWLDRNKSHKNLNVIPEVDVVTIDEIKKISSFKSLPEVIAILDLESNVLDENEILTTISLILDTVQDPGNLGNIIRIADWFGIRNIICSPGCADCYNPKVVQASMGAIMRIKVFYLDLEAFLANYSKNSEYNVYGTFLEGENIYTTTLSAKGAIIMGNESQGISKSLIPYIRNRIFIPSKETGIERVDSLNVSSAAAIVCSEFMRRLP